MMFNVKDSKPVWNDTHTVKRSAKLITQTRQSNTTKSSLQNSRLRPRKPGTKYKKPCGDLNNDGFTSNLGFLVKDGHLNPCFRLGTFWAVGLIWDKLPLLLSAQAFQPFDWLSHSYFWGLPILYLESTYHKWGVGAEDRNLQVLFGHLIVTLTTETKSHLGDHSVVVWWSSECSLSLGLDIHPWFLH